MRVKAALDRLPSGQRTAQLRSARSTSKADLHLAGCERKAAEFACTRWHYSHKMPAGKLVTIGAWEDGQFIGAVVFGRGANNRLGSPYGLKQTEICELVRVALRAHLAPVSRIVAVALRLLRAQCPGVKLIVSYADPEQGHVGGIYQAGGWLYAGPSQAQRELVIGGVDVHKRTAGARWGTAAPARLRALTRLPVEYGPKRFKHTYLMPLDRVTREQIEPLRREYPKRPAQTESEAHHGSQRTAAHAHAA
jgi:hypothetical protein